MNNTLKTADSYKGIWDKVSTVTSVLCLIHCVCLPLIFSTLPLLGFEIIENPYIEIGTIAIAFAIGGYAIVKGYKQYHHNKTIVLLFIAGLVAMITANSIEHIAIAAIFKITGAAAIIIAHIKNRKSCKQCITCNHRTK